MPRYDRLAHRYWSLLLPFTITYMRSAVDTEDERYMYTLGMDIGGTFTDFTLVDRESGEVTVDKEPTTPANPAEER